MNNLEIIGVGFLAAVAEIRLGLILAPDLCLLGGLLQTQFRCLNVVLNLDYKT